MEIWYRKGGTHGVGELELISSDAKLVDMLAQMPCLDGADNYAEVQHNVQVEDEIEGPTFEALGEVSSDGEYTLDFDTQSEGDVDDMKGDNEGTSKVRRKKIMPWFKQYRKKVYLKNPKLRLGMQFENRQINQDVQTFAIKKLSLEHTCGRVDKLKFANPKWICDKFSSKIKRNTYWNMKAFQGEVLSSYHVRVPKTQVYRAKRLAKAQIEENYIQQPVIGVDACYLKGPYPGQILTTTGVNSSNGLFLIAYVVANCIATRATTIPCWEAEMEKMKEEDFEAWKLLVQRPPKNWTRSHFHLKMANQRVACRKWKHPVGPRIFKIIEKNKMGVSQCIPRLAGEKMYQGGLPPIRPSFHNGQPGRPKRVRTKEPGEVQVPALNPPNPLPLGYTAPPVKLRRLFIKLDVEHVEKNATIEEDVEDRARETGKGIGRGKGAWNQAARVSSLQPMVSGINQGRANLPMTYSQQVPLQPPSSSLTQETTPCRGRFKHSVKI
ncbi:unnamed protein product [Prunus armeniaca]